MRNLFVLVLLLKLSLSAAAAGGTPLSVDRTHSQIDVEVKATMDSFTAHLENYDAAVAIDPTSRLPVSATLRFKFGDVKTGKKARDEEMNHWQETEKFPDGLFTLTSLSRTADGRHSARGTLHLHGVQREIAFPVSIKTDNALWAIDGEAPLDTREFGLPVFRKFALLKVSPLVKVRFHLQGMFVSP